MSKIKTKYKIAPVIISTIILNLLMAGALSFIWYFYTSYVEEFRLEKPFYLWLLFIIPLLGVIYIIDLIRKNRAYRKLASLKNQKFIISGIHPTRSLIKYLIFQSGILFIIISLTNPQFGKNEKKMKQSGIEVMVAMDVSNSMLARDLSESKSRLDITKLAIQKLLNQLSGDRVGIVVFAGKAFNYTPITSDYDFIKMDVSTISTNMLSAQGTSIGEAINTSLKSFDEKSKVKKAIIVFSDGENHEDDAIQAAKNAKDKGVKVFTVGMGTDKGVPIPILNGEQIIGTKKDNTGNTVLTKLNEQMMIDIAKAGGGVYLRANKSNVKIEEIIDVINDIEKSKFDTKEFLEYEDQYQWFLAIGMTLLIISLLISESKTKKLSA